MACTKFLNLLFLLFIIISFISCAKDKDAKKKKKDIRDYTDAEIERLYDEWEEADDDKLEEDELPEWKREPPKVDISKLNTNDPEGLLQQTKQGKTLMMFATVSGNPTQTETEKITQIWQGSLFNANYETQRYVVSEDRVIFMIKNGALAWEIKEYLVQQDRCAEVTIEGKSYPGKGANGDKKENTASKKETGKTEKKKKKKSNETKKPKTEL